MQAGDVRDFLGFTHLCGQSRKNGKFLVLRKTVRKRLLAKLKELKEELRRRWHEPVADLGQWLRSVVQGYFNYRAVPGNLASLNCFRCFRREVSKRWLGALRRRGQKHPMIWARLDPLIERWLPLPKIFHPLCLAKTSYTCKMNDLAQSSIRTFPI
jgi:RNA-directed DNA polymerase